jgi:hypothetical protein
VPPGISKLAQQLSAGVPQSLLPGPLTRQLWPVVVWHALPTHVLDEGQAAAAPHCPAGPQICHDAPLAQRVDPGLHATHDPFRQAGVLPLHAADALCQVPAPSHTWG